MPTPIEKYWHGQEYNDCDRLNIAINRTIYSDRLHARCVIAHLLTREENMGNHNLYMDVIDKDNKRINNSVLLGRNNNIDLSARIDKPPNEFGTNFSMFTQDTISCWVGDVPGLGKIPSDIVSNFSTRWGGEIVGGQDYGHISYYVIFKIVDGGVVPPDPLPPPTDCDKVILELADLQLKYASLLDRMNKIKELAK